MKANKFNAAVVAILASILAHAADAGETVVSPEIAGIWDGRAQIIVVWCHQRDLPVAISIAPDGAVSGAIGDATIGNGQLTRNRGWLGRKLSLATDWIIRGELAGPIVASESIERAAFSMPLNLDGGELKGGMHTSGSKIGGKDRMILSARALVLKRTSG